MTTCFIYARLRAASRLTVALRLALFIAGPVAAQEVITEGPNKGQIILPPGKQRCIQVLPVTLYFPPGSKSLTPLHRAALKAFRDVEERAEAQMSPEHGFQVEAKGYTDKTRSEAADWRLSAERTVAAVEYLFSIGTPKRDLRVRAGGPVTPNKSDIQNLDPAHNRRVEVIAKCVIN
jgi:outer membrane protein OmpA-like peptidoglycan-associated protein